MNVTQQKPQLGHQQQQQQQSAPPPPQQQVVPMEEKQQLTQRQQQAQSIQEVFDKNNAEAWLAIGSYAETLDDADKSFQAYNNVLKFAPNDPKALTMLANLYRSRDMFGKAAELFQRALHIQPDNGETWGLLGHCYLMLDDLPGAYTAYQEALRRLQNTNAPKLWHGIGILYDRYGSLEYAEESFTRVLQMDPNFEKASEIYFRLGIIYKHQGKLQQALECFRYILPVPPSPLTQPDVWFQIGAVLEQQHDFNGARDAYERVLQANPRHAKVLQQLGCLYAQQEASFADLDAALRLLAQALELDNSDAQTWYQLGRVHMSRGDYTSAYDAYQQAVNRDARNPTFWCSIGVLYYQISQYRDALDAYTRAIRLNPYISEVWYDLGTLYETCNNQISDALDAYKQAATLDPNNPHIQERLNQLIKYQKEGGANQGAPLPPPTQHQPRLPQGMIPTASESSQQLVGQNGNSLRPPSFPSNTFPPPIQQQPQQQQQQQQTTEPPNKNLPPLPYAIPNRSAEAVQDQVSSPSIPSKRLTDEDEIPGRKEKKTDITEDVNVKTISENPDEIQQSDTPDIAASATSDIQGNISPYSSKNSVLKPMEKEEEEFKEEVSQEKSAKVSGVAEVVEAPLRNVKEDEDYDDEDDNNEETSNQEERRQSGSEDNKNGNGNEKSETEETLDMSPSIHEKKKPEVNKLDDEKESSPNADEKKNSVVDVDAIDEGASGNQSENMPDHKDRNRDQDHDQDQNQNQNEHKQQFEGGSQYGKQNQEEAQLEIKSTTGPVSSSTEIGKENKVQNLVPENETPSISNSRA
ncbi:hypothetical protein LJB42_001470 [Komagataella kurtzmanii]|nr:hypothetical protein LJB42_001470 [Komagataella kurtzmanii]